MTDPALPPHDLAAEAALLGAYLLASDAPDCPPVAAADFFSSAHRSLWEIIQKALAAGKPMDPVVLAEQGADKGLLADCMNACASPASAAHYAEIVTGKAILRKLIQAGRQTMTEAQAGDPEEALQAAQQRIFEIGREGHQKEPTVPATVEAVLQDIRESRPADFPFGIQKLDEALGGSNRGEVITVYGESSHLKSSLCMSMILEALGEGARVVVADFEMGRDLWFKRLLAQISETSLSEITRRCLSPASMSKVEEAAEIVKKFNVTYLHSPSLATVQARSRQVKADIVIYDYIQQATGGEGKRNENLDEVVTKIMGSLKRLSLDIGCVVYAVSQVVKDIPNNSRPRPKDIKASSAIYQSSDKLVCSFWPSRKGKAVDEAMYVVGVDKQKNGPLLDVILQVKPWCARIINPVMSFSSGHIEEAVR